MSEPRRVALGEDARAAIRAGGHVILAPGVHRGGVEVVNDLVLEGEPGAVLDAAGRGEVILVQRDGVDVVIDGVELRGGHAELGAGLAVLGDALVSLRRCRVVGNRCVQLPAAGLGVVVGKVLLEACEFGDRDGVFATGEAQLDLVNVTVASVLVVEGATVVIDGGTVGTLAIRGTPRESPTVTLRAAAVGTLTNDVRFPGTVVVER